MKKQKWTDLPPYNWDFDIRKSKTPVQDDLFSMSTEIDEEGVITLSSDISLLFNQQRLDNKMSPQQLRSYIDRYTPNQSPYLQQLDDDTLMNTLKSRHVQSLSEIRAWAECCMDMVDQETKRLIEEQSSQNENVDTEASVNSSE